MKKICFITTISGTMNSFFLETAKYLHNYGNWDITMICSDDETKSFSKKIPDYIEYYPIEMKRGISLGGIQATYNIYKNLKEKKYDIVQYSTPNAAFYASIASIMAGIKIRVYHIMGFRYLGFKGIKRCIFKKIEQITCLFSTSIECITKSNMNLGVKENIFQEQKATIIWNGSTGGVDLKRFDINNAATIRTSSRKYFEIDASEFVFGYVGRITTDKGINELLDAFSQLENRAKLFIIGAKDYNNDSDLENKIEQLKENKHVIIHDAVSDIEKYYPCFDVLVLPSYREGFGMVIAEAAAMGVPAITTRIPGPIDVVIENETAFLVEVKNTEDLFDKMKYCIDHVDLVKQMSNNCVKYIKKMFDADILRQKILEQKERILNNKY